MKRISATEVREQSVFLNVPSDESYEPILLTLMTTIVAGGRLPRAAVGISASQPRLPKIIELLENCRTSVHELTPPAGQHRFNMPFELGLACQLSHQKGRAHDFVILETRQYRLHKTLSDLNGHDVLGHNGTQKGTIQAVLDALPRESGGPSHEAVRKLLGRVKARVARLKVTERRSTILTTDMWNKTLAIIQDEAVKQGLLS